MKQLVAWYALLWSLIWVGFAIFEFATGAILAGSILLVVFGSLSLCVIWLIREA